MAERINCYGLKVDTILYHFIEDQVIPETKMNSKNFWEGFSEIVYKFSQTNHKLLSERSKLQNELKNWHSSNRKKSQDKKSYYKFLKKIGYLLPIPETVSVKTENVDTELTIQAGPQLVVPILNARYSLNAANARWGSLYDALYGSNVISEKNGAEKKSSYNPLRGDKVVSYVREFLDKIFPLKINSHKNVIKYFIEDKILKVLFKDGLNSELEDNSKFLGYLGNKTSPSNLLFINNGLHIDIKINVNSEIGKLDSAGIQDVILESALSTILDLEDSVTVVDAVDKVNAYKNWQGLLKGNLEEKITKGNKTFIRKLNKDRKYINIKNDDTIILPGRSLLFLRNVGHLMTNQAILYDNDKEIPEGILDAVISVSIALSDLKNSVQSQTKNSRAGSIYIVKPKMHGPKEVAFANHLFSEIESFLGLKKNTVKLGIMDEERRTSLNLKACLKEASERVAFINTGFLDRTGDEIHSSMTAGPMMKKDEMKASLWLSSYEKNNVLTGLSCGLNGRGQIGKGMWAMPDLMKEMLNQKIVHPLSGANTAWVPSPTAATLHSLHYHEIDVWKIQEALNKVNHNSEIKRLRFEILEIPLAPNTNWSRSEIQKELDNNIQSILGYVVRWIEHGIGCSKVPDINNIGLMEDRATLRISSQHVTNWFYHGIINKRQILNSLSKMAKIVDNQNKNDIFYIPMSKNIKKSFAFLAAKDLVLEGLEQPNGYTEPLLHAWRLKFKLHLKKTLN